MGNLKSMFLKRVEVIVVVVSICILLLISLAPTIHNILQTPDGSFYTNAYNYIPDYYQFISWMRDGAHSHFDLTSRFSAEVFPRKFLHTFFPVIGFIASKFGLSNFVMFTVSRVVLGFVRLLLVYLIVSRLFPKHATRLFIFIVSVILPSFLLLQFGNHTVEPQYFLFGITNFDVFRRLTFLPHHLASQILFILTILFYGYALKKDDLFYTFFSAILLFIASLINPATLTIGAIITGGSAIVFSATLYQKKIHRMIMHSFILFTALLLCGLYYKYYAFTTFPWNIFLQNEVGERRTWNFLDYLGALGIAFPLSLVPFILRKWLKNPLFILLSIWAFGPIIAFPIIKYLGYHHVLFRLFQIQQYMPLGILAGYGLLLLKKKIHSPSMKAAIFVILIICCVPYYYFSMVTQIKEQDPTAYNVYVPKAAMDAITFLQSNTQENSVVMAGYFMGQMLPAFTDNRVVIGHRDGTYNYPEKLGVLTEVYSDKTTATRMQEILTTQKIDYVFFSQDTSRPQASVIPSLNNARLVYENELNYIYKIQR